MDADFLGVEPDHLRCTRDFSSGRSISSHKNTHQMNRLYAVEANLTLTGSMADHRLRLDASLIPAFAHLLAAEVLSQTKSASDSAIKALRSVGNHLKVDAKWVSEAAKDLVKNAGKSVVLAGSHLPGSTHVLAFAMNQALKAVGKTVEYLEVEVPATTSYDDLVEELKKGSINTLIFVGGNPGYDNPRDWEDLLKDVARVVRFGYSVDETSELADDHLASTHYLESWADGFSWSRDALFPVQPLIEPLFDGISELDFLARLAGEKRNAHALVKATFAELSDNGDFNVFLREGHWTQSPVKFTGAMDFEELVATGNTEVPSTPSVENLDLTLVPSFNAWDGRYANNGWMQECPDPLTKLTWDNAILISPRLAKELEQASGVSILPHTTMLNDKGVVAPDTSILDRGKEDAPMAKLRVGDVVVEGPLHVQPGLANYSVVAPLGYGRRVVGRVGEGTGFDAYPLLAEGKRVSSGATLELTIFQFEVSYVDDHGHHKGHFHKIDASSEQEAIQQFKEEVGEKDYKVSVVKKSTKPLGRRKLANVQEHWSMEGRAIIRESTAEHYQKEHDFVDHMGIESHSPPIYGKDQDMTLANKARQTPRGASAYEHPDHTFEGSNDYGTHQWGMTIDLNSCTGCTACVVACQSENNIPIVGKDQVLRGREMHWIRMDRYFSSEERQGGEIPEDVQVSFQGMACAHCETAPCESVCPVNATIHDEEGLNAMAYNRCVGTRYCANNCPYKVRRFNFFDWNKRGIGEFYEGPLGDKNDPLPSLQKNPDVTVRMRGVMEKCTYCVQRIQEAKIRTKVNAQRSKQLATGDHGADLKLEEADLKVPDGTIKTACQQVCPAEAIEFGDISDENSA
ncbi:MAG: 4Fe-4S dicluster domain-containing protein, partial [Opitutales bacterium]